MTELRYRLLGPSGLRVSEICLGTMSFGDEGVLTGKYTRGGDPDTLRRQANEARGRTSERNLEIARTVDAVADNLGVSSAQVATAWVSSHRCTHLDSRPRR